MSLCYCLNASEVVRGINVQHIYSNYILIYVINKTEIDAVSQLFTTFKFLVYRIAIKLEKHSNQKRVGIYYCIIHKVHILTEFLIFKSKSEQLPNKCTPKCAYRL